MWIMPLCMLLFPLVLPRKQRSKQHCSTSTFPSNQSPVHWNSSLGLVQTYLHEGGVLWMRWRFVHQYHSYTFDLHEMQEPNNSFNFKLKAKDTVYSLVRTSTLCSWKYSAAKLSKMLFVYRGSTSPMPGRVTWCKINHSGLQLNNWIPFYHESYAITCSLLLKRILERRRSTWSKC